jgi:hypothetical protein
VPLLFPFLLLFGLVCTSVGLVSLCVNPCLSLFPVALLGVLIR